MDDRALDRIARVLADHPSRRGVLGLLAATLAAAGAALPSLADAAGKKGNGNGKGKKNKRCRKANQGCGGRKRCCKGLACTGGRCGKPAAPGCANDADCDAGEVCQGGACVPGTPPECINDADCDFNETCDGGTCACDLRINGRCVRRCDTSVGCPGPASCRNHFPANGLNFDDGVCVDEPFFLCDTPSCDGVGDNGCQFGEICVAMGCGAVGVTTFRCIQAAFGSDFED